MKIIAIVLLAVFASSVNGQVPPNPLFQSQDAIQAYHDYYETLKVDVRNFMSTYVKSISGEILDIITSTMDTWRRQEFSRVVGVKNTPQIGETISRCSYESFSRMFDLQTAVFEGIEDWHEYTVGLQISVIAFLTEFNIATRYDYFMDEFNPVIQDAHNRFQFDFVPDMEARLRDLRDAQPEITQSFSQCISTLLKH
ncbi:hypothetical protein DMENIID0001_075160 [Sergentomyia squamirostris]